MTSSSSIRRHTPALLFTTVLLVSGCSGEPGGTSSAASAHDPIAEFEQLERDYDARVGVSVIDLADGTTVSYNEHERFGFASTMKVYAAAALLDTTTAAERSELVRWTREDVDAAGYSPVTEGAVDTGLNLDELAEAAVRESDNTAMNLMLERLGGPEGLRAALEGAGDSVSRPAAFEPGLNEVSPTSEANTSTAAALADHLERIATGSWLDDDDRDLLLGWMSGNATGDTLIRAGIPDGWTVVEKSGGAGSIRNDVAIVQPPEGEPIVVVILTERNDPGQDYDDTLVADLARAALPEGP